jgi:glucose/arabinose dehydrogenase
VEDTEITRRQALAAGATLAATAGCTQGSTDDEPTSEEDSVAEFEIETVADGFSHPWGLAFLPDSGLLVTERERGDGARLTLLDREDGSREPVAGIPEVDTAGQGGLLDVTLHPQFPAQSWVYLTYSATNEVGDSATHLCRGRLDRAGRRLSTVELLHVAEPFVDSDGHFGSRAVFGPEGDLYVTSGDRQFKNFGPDHVAQDRSNDLGGTLRLRPDGSIPSDNPFVDDAGASDALYSYGHRNSQGMTVHPETGAIWQSEHGENAGDEVNIIEKGGNYGWPVADAGCEYGTSRRVGDPPADRPDTVAPVHTWECGTDGFPPAGATFYDGDAFPAWQGALFVGNLAGQYLGRFTVDGRSIEEQSRLLADRGWRIREVAVAPDTGHLYLAVDDGTAPIVRLVPP